MSKFIRSVIFVGAVICLVTASLIVWLVGLPERAAYTGYLIRDERYAPEIAANAPLFGALALNGGTKQLVDLKGQVVLINFWATWCEPCKTEMPELQTVFETFHGKGFTILGVNLGENELDVQRWVEAHGLTFDIVIDVGQQIAALYQLRGQPSSYLIAPNGIIVQIFYGPTTREGLEAAIAPLLPA